MLINYEDFDVFEDSSDRCGVPGYNACVFESFPTVIEVPPNLPPVADPPPFSVPEPGTGLLLAGMVALGFLRRKSEKFSEEPLD